MDIWKIIILALLVLFLGWGVLSLEREKEEMLVTYAKLKEVTDKLKGENERTKAQIEYYAKTENLLKASREQFNFKSEGERMMIIVPSVTSSKSQ